MAKLGRLLALEQAILQVAARTPEVHGFGVARELRDTHGGGLTAHGTLYKALARLSAARLLVSRWEPPELAEAEGRPRRRLYRITDAGRAALAEAAATLHTPAETARVRASARPARKPNPAGGAP